MDYLNCQIEGKEVGILTKPRLTCRINGQKVT